MAFKLGNKPLPGIAHGGNIDKKHKFKVKRASLESGTLGEAKMDGSIEVDTSVPEGSKLEKRVIAHEAIHAKEIKSGRIAYGDDWVRADGKTYPRKDGKIKYNGEWKPEGDSSFPWEKRAEKAEKNV